MSLTSLLDHPSFLRDFFCRHFGNTKEIVKDINDEISKLPLIGNSNLLPADAGTIGTAFDYRARFYFQNYDPHATVAFEGAKLLLDHNYRTTLLHRSLIYELFSRLYRDVLTIQPSGKKLRAIQEERLNIYCLVLTFFEQQFRMRDMSIIVDREESILESFLASKTVEGFMGKVRSHQDKLLHDLRALSDVFYRDWGAYLQERRFILNPTFSGSRDVGGADADFIMGRILFELKTNRTPRPINRVMLWQLIGYPLLDFRNEYKLSKVGFYFARRGYRIEWTLANLLSILSGRQLSLISWRKQLSKVIGHSERVKLQKDALFGLARMGLERKFGVL
ncbi:MAG TPA: hypothetical protein VNK24_11950 [Elusimicrobiota bacterium]|nr:hypothetical protein [Elusimicrobiota bacterium]